MKQKKSSMPEFIYVDDASMKDQTYLLFPDDDEEALHAYLDAVGLEEVEVYEYKLVQKRFVRRRTTVVIE